MKIAIPSDDGLTVAPHTGRAKGFVIFEITENNYQKLAYRTVQSEDTSADESVCKSKACNGHQSHNEHGHSHKNHSVVLDLISDCDIVLAGGAGPRLVNDLSLRGIKIGFCRERTIDDIARLFTENKLEILSQGICDHHRH